MEKIKYIIILLLFIALIGTIIYITSYINTYTGYFKVDRAADNELLSKYFQDCNCTKELRNNENGRTMSIFHTSYVSKNVTKYADVEQSAIKFIKDALGVDAPPAKTVDHSNATGGGIVRFGVQNYRGISVCGISDESGWISVNGDGSVDDVLITLYPNLTAPTRPKLTDEQIGKIVGAPPGWLHDGKLCIFPKWHQEGEYWTYHLAKDYGGPIIDTWTGETLKEPRPPIIG